jgi:nucleotide-binding universal stress UspA family protein
MARWSTCDLPPTLIRIKVGPVRPANNEAPLPENVMTFKSLLVLLDDELPCIARTQVAIRLARQFDCHLVGLAPTGLLNLPTVPGSAAALSEFAATAWDALRDQAERVADRFRNDCRAAGLASYEAVLDEADRARSLIRHAHCNDLTLLTQADPDAPGYRAASELVETVVLHSARPTLILPHSGRFEQLGTRALVAWDDSREAARAVADALPLLRAATDVRLATWPEPDAAERHLLQSRLEAARSWLGRHGIDAQVQIEPAGSPVADALLACAIASRSDLIVMGAYGHARWAERLLGGATRGLLRSMAVPVLMSH